MKISKILNSFENSWDRNEILLKIKKGLDTNEIINEFLVKNEEQINEFNTLLKPEDINLINQLEKLSICEANLLNKINNLNYKKNNDKQYTIKETKNSLSNDFHSNRIGSFMINWSNKFVVIALLVISAIALSKQAWA